MIGVAEGALSGNQQHAISGDGKGGRGFNGYSVSHLCLPHAEQRLFISEVHFDVPALEVGFDDLSGVQCGVSADEVCRISIEQLRSFTRTVGQRRDDDQLQSLPGSGRALRISWRR